MDIHIHYLCRIEILPSSVLSVLAGTAFIQFFRGLHSLVLDIFSIPKKYFSYLPKTPRMKGVVLRSNNGNAKIELRDDLAIPKISHPNEVLIKVYAIGLDTIDEKVMWHCKRSVQKQPQYFSQYLSDHSIMPIGRECSGVVTGIGKNVTAFSVGDKVWAVSPPHLKGFSAEYVVVKDNYLGMKPPTLTFEEAASLPLNIIQAYSIINSQAEFSPHKIRNKRILVVIGNSSLGLLIIQLLKSCGGHVTAVTPTAGLPMCHELNVDDVIVYSVNNFVTELKKRKRFDIIINEAGPIIHQLCLDISSPAAKVFTTISQPKIFYDVCGILEMTMNCLQKLKTFIEKLTKVIFVEFRISRFCYDKQALDNIFALIEDGKIHPIIEKVHEISNVIQAFHQLAKFDNVGKTVVRVTYE